MTTDNLVTEIDNSLHSIAENINKHETAILCGAGISKDSGFPVVNDIVPYILLSLCVNQDEITSIESNMEAILDSLQRQNYLKNIITKKLEISTEILDKVVNSLPFESIVEILVANSEVDNMLDIYCSDTYSPPIKPNPNHMLIAQLVATGKVKTIVTTNFDKLIERALEQLGKVAGQDFDVIFHEEDFNKIDWSKDKCRLIKLHGSIEDKQAMAITLNKITQRENYSHREAVIKQLFSKGKHHQVLVLGYSCSDVFDVSPQIVSLDADLKQVFLVQHSDVYKVEDIREQEQKNPFRAFNNGIRLFFNTNILVENIWKATIEEPHQVNEFNNGNPEWKKKIKDWCIDSIQACSEVFNEIVLGLLFDSIGEWQAAIRRYENVLVYTKMHKDIRREGIALNNIGNAYGKLGEYNKSVDYFKQALEITCTIGDIEGECKALNNLASSQSILGNNQEAMELYKQALEKARRGGYIQIVVGCLSNICKEYRNLGEYNKATGLLNQAIEIARQFGDLRGEISSLSDLGVIYANIGEYQKAINCFTEAWEKSVLIGDIASESTNLRFIGNIYLQSGEYRKAMNYYEKSLEIARRLGDFLGLSTTLGSLSLTYRHLGENHKAIELAQQALNIARQIGNLQGVSVYTCVLASEFRNIGEYTKSIELYKQSLEIAQHLGDSRTEGDILSDLGLVFSDLGEYRKAITAYEKSLEICHRIGNIEGEGIVLLNSGLTYSSMGDKENAIESLNQSKACFSRLGLLHKVMEIENIMKEMGK
jgi:tetratricopeptide (TPR) repeat protein